MSLKGRGQRAEGCPLVVINIKEPLVVLEDMETFVDDALVSSQAAL